MNGLTILTMLNQRLCRVIMEKIMKKIIAIVLSIMVITAGCAQDASINDGQITMDLPKDSTTSQMVDEAYFLNGELIEVNDDKVLIDSAEAGLVWVSLSERPPEVAFHSIVRVQFSGEIAESYPGQASGYALEVTQPFQENVEITFSELNDRLDKEEENHVVVWNNTKDIVAYAREDLDSLDGSYSVFVASVYDGLPIQLAYVKGETPDLNWFYKELEVQIAAGSWYFGPEFEAVEAPIHIGKITASEKDVPSQVDSSPYSMMLHTYEDQARNLSIDYFEVEGLLGELTQDYMNQSLYEIVDVYSRDYEDVSIHGEVLKQDDYLTIAYKGEHLSQGYEIEHYMTMDVASGTVITVDNLFNDLVAFKALFDEASTYKYESLEGVVVYIDGFDLVLTFVPSDDRAEREYVTFPMLELGPIMNTSFELPAS